MSLSDLLPEIDAIFDRFDATAAAPGCAFGIVVDGALVHSGGRGTLRHGENVAPDADSPFRIASMTKSFTATTVIGLRDDGVLGLDDEVTTWVPELADLGRWSRDSPPITIRALLTMSAGLPTDDPWGDRQQDLAEDAFLRFLSGGLTLAWPPATQFEYANLGYAILGLVVARATGEPYRVAVEQRILGPLGLTSTSYDLTGLDPARVASGHVKRGDDWVDEPHAAHGAFAPMGGLFSSVRDLATWAGWFAAGFPARDDPDEARPLARASRREMQQVQRTFAPELRWESAARPPVLDAGGYGYGLFVGLDPRRGRMVGHGGGYPGFGSHMRWHPASGIGVVGLANGRYAQLAGPCREALELLVDGDAAPVHRPSAWPAVLEARTAVDRLIDAWDDDIAERLFAMNVALDEDVASRRAAIDRLREVHGRLRPDPADEPKSMSAADLEWWLAGDRGRVKVDIFLNAERPPRVQWLRLRSVPEPPPELSAMAERIVVILAVPGPAWPSDLVLGEAVNREALERELRATEAVFGPLTLGPVTAGDGERQASWTLRGERGDVTLSIELDQTDGAISAASLVPASPEPPVHLA